MSVPIPIPKQFRLHYAFLGTLGAELNGEEIDHVKNGLTYDVVPKTLQQYLKLHPKLTPEQQRTIHRLLLEAREHAMDAGSSDEKHTMFGKYKGRINNYLSAEGFDAKQAERDTGRNPSVGMYGDFTFVNNVLFNYRHRTIDGGDQRSYFNIINNYFKPGPGTPSSAIAYRILKPESERSKVIFDNFGKAYVAGNMVEGYPRVSADNWDGGVQPDSKAPVEEVLPKIRVNEPFSHAPLTMDSPQVAFEKVLANAGATLPKRDAVDLRIMQMVRTGIVPPIEISSKSAAKAVEVGYAPNWVQELVDSVPKGFLTDPSEVGGYPNYQGTTRIDSDSDGMPDEWEKRHRLDPNNPLDANHDQNGDGYTNIEKYINGLSVNA